MTTECPKPEEWKSQITGVLKSVINMMHVTKAERSDTISYLRSRIETIVESQLAAANEREQRLRAVLEAEIASANVLADALRDGEQPVHVVAAVNAFDAREWSIRDSQPVPDWLIDLRDKAIDERAALDAGGK